MLEVKVVQRIERPVEVVRAQFADVRYHERRGHHSGVSFKVLQEMPDGCRYEQRTKSGPMTMRQELELTRPSPLVLENRVVRGMFTGGVIRFTFTGAGDDASEVTAEVRANLNPFLRLVRPLLERQLHTAFARGLEEDRLDLESGDYEVGLGPSA